MGLVQIDSSESSDIPTNLDIPDDLPLSCVYKLAFSLDIVSINKTIFYSSDFKTLLPSGWLNDKIINFYFELLSQHNKKTYYFSTFLFPKIKESLHSAIESYSDTNFSRYTCFFVPINTGSHWSIIKIQDNVLTGYDSLGEISNSIIRLIKNFYVNAVLRADDERVSFYYKPTNGKIPKQDNGDDCGVFCCLYGKYYLNSRDYFCFTSKDIPRKRREILHEILKGKILYS